VYKGLDIGTAKPSQKALSKAPHYNISVLEPNEEENTDQFEQRIDSVFTELKSEAVFVVGGSTRYLECLLFENRRSIPGKNPDFRAKSQEGLWSESDLFRWLSLVDPIYQKYHMDGYNPQRTLRALEVWLYNRQPFSSYHTRYRSQPEQTLVIGLNLERALLYQRINKRVEFMIELGLIEEIRSILSQGFSFNDPGLKTIGYQEFEPFFAGRRSLEEVIAMVQRNTRRYAKRQLTYFRRWDFVEWVEVTDSNIDEVESQLANKITNFLQQ
jgi:tRNA dimethylallyltransferase